MERPQILTVKDVKEILKIGNDKAYKLFRQKDFPSFKIEETNYIMEDKFYEWLGGLHREPKKQYIMSYCTSFNWQGVHIG